MRTARSSAPWRIWAAALLGAVVLYVVSWILAPFFVPLFWGAVLGTLFYRFYPRLEALLGHRSTLAALLLTLAVLLVVLLPILALTYQVVTEATKLVKEAQRAFSGAQPLGPESLVNKYLWPLASRLGLSRQELSQAVFYALRAIGRFLLSLGPGLVGGLLLLLLDVAFTLVALYFAFRAGPAALGRLADLLPLPRRQFEAAAARLHDIIAAAVVSTLIVATIQGTAGGLAFWALGLPHALFWGIVMGMTSVLPVIGPFVVWIPAAIYLALTGHYLRAAALTAFGATFVNLVDNLLRPYLIHGRIPINNFYLIFGILGGVELAGLTGLLFGPVAVALALEVVRLYRERRGPDIALRPSGPGEV